MDELDSGGVVNLAALLGGDKWIGYTSKERLQQELIESYRREIKHLEEQVCQLKGETGNG